MKRLIYALVLCAPSALAQPRGLDPKEAQVRYEEGVSLYTQKKFGEARVKFLEACAALPTAKCMKNLGAAEIEIGLYAESATHFRQYLQDPASQKDPARGEAEKMFNRARALCSEVEIHSTPGTNFVINDTDLGNAPFRQTVFIPSGTQVFKARLGDKNKLQPLTAEPGRQHTIEVMFAEPGSTTNQNGNNPPPTREQTRALMFPPPTPAIILVGLGAVGIGFGVGFGVDSAGKLDQFNKQAATLRGQCINGAQTAECNDLRDVRASSSTSATISTISYITGGALILGGALWWLLAPRKVTERVSVNASLNYVSTTLSF